MHHSAATQCCIYQAVQLVVPQMPGRLQLVVLTASVTLTPYTPPGPAFHQLAKMDTMPEPDPPPSRRPR